MLFCVLIQYYFLLTQVHLHGYLECYKGLRAAIVMKVIRRHVFDTERGRKLNFATVFVYAINFGQQSCASLLVVCLLVCLGACCKASHLMEMRR